MLENPVLWFGPTLFAEEIKGLQQAQQILCLYWKVNESRMWCPMLKLCSSLVGYIDINFFY